MDITQLLKELKVNTTSTQYSLSRVLTWAASSAGQAALPESLVFVQDYGSADGNPSTVAGARGRGFFANGTFYDIYGQRVTSITESAESSGLGALNNKFTQGITLTRGDGTTVSNSWSLYAGDAFINFGSDTITLDHRTETVPTLSINAAKSTDADWSNATDNKLVTQLAVKNWVLDQIDTFDAMEYKGTYAGAGTSGQMGTFSPAITAPANCKGWTYKTSTAGYIGTTYVEVGDLIVINKNLASGSIAAADCDVFQTNIEYGLGNGQLIKNAEAITAGTLLVPAVGGWEMLDAPQGITAAGQYFLTVNTDGTVAWQQVVTSDEKVDQVRLAISGKEFDEDSIFHLIQYLAEVAIRYTDDPRFADYVEQVIPQPSGTSPLGITLDEHNNPVFDPSKYTDDHSHMEALIDGFITYVMSPNRVLVETLFSGLGLTENDTTKELNGHTHRAPQWIRLEIIENDDGGVISYDTDYSLINDIGHVLSWGNGSNDRVIIEEGVPSTTQIQTLAFTSGGTTLGTYNPLASTSNIDSLITWDTLTFSNS